VCPGASYFICLVLSLSSHCCLKVMTLRDQRNGYDSRFELQGVLRDGLLSGPDHQDSGYLLSNICSM
jgi:hypothetical protein